MFPVSRTVDRYDTSFDHDALIANAGLIVVATLMARLGLERLANEWVKTGSHTPGRELCTLIAAMCAGATHIDHTDVLRAGATQSVLPFRVMAPSTIGTFLRSFTFGFVRQLDAVAARLLTNAWAVGAGPGDSDLMIDLDSTICEVHGHAKQGAGYGYTKCLGYHPLVATRAGTGEILFSRMRKGSAGSSRGINRFIDELAGVLRRAKATHRRQVCARRFGVLVVGTAANLGPSQHDLVDHRHQSCQGESGDREHPR
ncbi:MAG: transposase [Ilumatobacter sp.]|uniref:transposase n=1 Tax=Ilumatobacter sp. TaxID=1967498 RepID=UPI00391AC513